MVGNRESTNKELLSTIFITFSVLYKKVIRNVLKNKIIGVKQSMIANDSKYDCKS